jgi:predicted RNase H-like HicB family nuclease
VLYPIYVYKEEGSAYGVTFPDFPGCFSAADEAQNIAVMAQEAVEAHFSGDDEPIPAPSAPDAWADDPDYQGGFWMMVDVDLSKVNTKAVRLNISLPENLVHRIDAAAKAGHLSRSAFLASAALHEIERRGSGDAGGGAEFQRVVATKMRPSGQTA